MIVENCTKIPEKRTSFCKLSTESELLVSGGLGTTKNRKITKMTLVKHCNASITYGGIKCSVESSGSHVGLTKRNEKAIMKSILKKNSRKFHDLRFKSRVASSFAASSNTGASKHYKHDQTSRWQSTFITMRPAIMINV